MPKIQTYVNNNVYEQIANLVTVTKQGGIEEVSLTNFSSMLLDLGLRVYMIQQQRKKGCFNQMEYNNIMLDNLARVRARPPETMKMSALSHEVMECSHF